MSRATLKSVATLVLVLFCLWQVISAFATIAVFGQGWLALIFWSVIMIFAAKLLHQNHPVRSFFRELWAKA